MKEPKSMRTHFANWGLAFVAVLSCAYVLLAQNPPAAQRRGQTAAAAARPAAAWSVPKTAWGEPDFSGMWEPKMPPTAREYSGYSFVSHKTVVPLMTPWGKQQYDASKPSWGPKAVEDSTDMVNPTTGKEIGCAPTGVPRIWVHPFPTKIVQAPGTVYLLHEFNHTVREIYTNKGRQHDKDVDPLWMGNSLGWWEGNTLVIDTVGFNGRTWIDRAGLPSSDQLHVIERLTRPAENKLRVDITVNDPKAYTAPVVGFRELELEPGWPLTEMICEDNITFNTLKNQGMEQ
jgi:hypothetical protein